jgi:hypothetical protein
MRRILLLSSLPLLAWIADGGDPPGPAADPTVLHAQPDSSRVLRSARSEQRRFELVRRNHLPWTWDRGSGPCDERIGRFCIWHSDGGPPWEPPPEPDPVVAARERLIDTLDDAALAFPGDAWIAGQRVRYLMEASRDSAATEAARQCRSPEPGWCEALLGYALHGAGDYIAADSAFDSALSLLSDRERARWTDLSAMLEGGDARRYARLGDAERATFEARFWWLADPLYILDGNDRRTEHFARHVIDRLQDRAGSTDGISWGSDLRELLIRYGSPAGWERVRDRIPGMHDRRIITRYPSGGRRFVPSAAYVTAPHEIPPDGWDLNPRRSRSGYAPAYVDSVLPLEHQLAVFRRGDSVRVVASFPASKDSLGRLQAGDAALRFAYDEDDFSQVVRPQAGDGVNVLDLLALARPGVVAVETFAPEARVAARARYGLHLDPQPPDQRTLSDLLLLSRADSLADALDSVLPLALPSHRIAAGDQVGVFWEMYGLSAIPEPYSLSIQLLDRNAGALRRLGVRMGVLEERTPLAVRWREDSGGQEVVARAFSIDMPEVAPGRYTLQLGITFPNRDPIHASRDIEITAPGP